MKIKQNYALRALTIALIIIGFHAINTHAQSALDGFDPNANDTVRAVVVQPDGKIIIGGDFTTVLGQPRNRIARLNTDGTLDATFNPNADGNVNTIAVQPDGKVLAGGLFTNIGGQPRNRIARLDATTGLVDTWNPNSSNEVSSIVVQSDGKVLAGGVFTNIGGQARNFIARLDATTGLADTWNPNANSNVWTIAVQPDGKVLAGGEFTAIGGQPRSRFARLTNDTAALSTLIVNSNAVGLTRDGSAPQFTRVIFEQSTDNGANWTFLGQATNSFASIAGEDKGVNPFKNENPLAPQAASYTLTGLSLPTGQNVLIRARGFYRSGYFNGSETIEDKVRNVFFLAPTAASVSIGGRVLTASGAGVRNAIVTLTKPSGEVLTARTGAFGYYRFDDIEVGQTVIVSVVSKRFGFAPQIITPAENIEELNFTAQP